MDKSNLSEQFERTEEQLLDAINLFSDEQINTVPFKDSWTGAQVADHVTKFQSGIPELFGGVTVKADRDPGEKVEPLKKLFLDHSIKMQSPDFVWPTDDYLEKDAIIAALQQRKQEITKVINDYDLDEICIGFQLPVFGTLTQKEWIYFIIFHTQRHTHQLQNIYEKVSRS
ncbi:DinB family protein [Pedobacter sp. HMF7647]|uniref:DinB family protein n=1 Tax=Hufsiella arboris TaxID=2695275 RepID=A0A7K1YBT0_9SPHI|nr:DinB family protein [Hufsiella arboris]MXV52047.1 DinB family protein [Hufsiella arboris]